MGREAGETVDGEFAGSDAGVRARVAAELSAASKADWVMSVPKVRHGLPSGWTTTVQGGFVAPIDARRASIRSGDTWGRRTSRSPGKSARAALATGVVKTAGKPEVRSDQWINTGCPRRKARVRVASSAFSQRGARGGEGLEGAGTRP